MPIAGIAGPVIVHADAPGNTGALIGAAVGGGLIVVALIAIATRYRAVSIQIKRDRSWKHSPKTEVNHKPLVISPFRQKKPKFEIVETAV
jgi:hypothetical protein